MTISRLFASGAVIALSGMMADAAGAATLDDVKERGEVRCGISEGLPGFSSPNDAGEWVGFDVDVCRAIAAAIFGDDTKVEYISLNSRDRFTALQSGEVDVLSRTTTFTLSRDTSLGFDFPFVNYYDGQGMMLPRELDITSVSELDGVTVCVRTGATSELNLADYFEANGMSYTSVVFANSDEIRRAYEAGRCDLMTGDRAQIAIRRSQLEDPQAHVILDEIISKEPLGPAVRHGDNEWADVVRWSFFAMVLAEEKGLTQDNVSEQRESSENPEVRRLLGVEGEFGDFLGLPAEWAYNVISSVGNYGESFERNLGEATPIGLSRGLNALWTDGGLIYSPPAN